MIFKRVPAWIFIKYDVKPPVFRCDRCQQTRPVHLPAAINDVAKQAEAFAESHRGCKEMAA